MKKILASLLTLLAATLLLASPAEATTQVTYVHRYGSNSYYSKTPTYSPEHNFRWIDYSISCGMFNGPGSLDVYVYGFNGYVFTHFYTLSVSGHNTYGSRIPNTYPVEYAVIRFSGTGCRFDVNINNRTHVFP